MSDSRIVWSDEEGGDLRKKKKSAPEGEVREEELDLKVRRLTSGKGRTVLEITGLPAHKKWCKKLAKDIKKSLGVGGAYKDDFIEVHGENFERLAEVLDKRGLKWKKVGG